VSNLEVLLPFLLLPPALTQGAPPPVAPFLERLLSRSTARRAALPHDHAAIFERFGFAAPYPHASMMALADGLPGREDAWMFAEPVHLDAGLSGMSLFPSDYLDVVPAEATALMLALNAHFTADNIGFHFGSDGRWYVRHAAGETPLTHSVESARAGMAAKLLPRSSGKLNWSAIQNEAQMVLYHHPVNEAREAAGKPTINGIWFWGGGTMPEPPPLPQNVDAVVTDSPLVRQLASHVDLPVQDADPVELFAGKNPPARNLLLVIDALERPALNLDVAQWSHRLQQLDTAWFQPIQAALADGRLTQVNLRAPAWELEHAFVLTRRQFQFGFWRRPKPLKSYA
jgi:hypothetical protein